MKACFPIWILFLFLLSSCGSVKKNRPVKDFQYEDFKATVVDDLVPTGPDTMNVLDTSYFIPQTDSVDGLFIEIDSLWSADLSAVKNDRVPGRDGRKFFNEQSFALHTNIRNLNSFKSSKKSASGTCREKECLLVAEVVKSKQIMYVYIGGELKDSFLVSTGVSGRETPNMNVRPTGPVFTKYTSRKFPGGNYQGLGNMPYAVFVKGGYAIHGTTQGNFSRLGKPASHGCIRLHPDDAKLFYNLVNVFGLQNSWVIVR